MKVAPSPILLGAGVLALFCLAAPSARGTVMLKLELQGLVGSSDAVFVGRAVKQKSRWTADNRIVTDTTFVVEQGLQGAREGQTMVVCTQGGVVDGIGMRVGGSPSFAPGERVVLFTQKRAGARWVVGMSQGVYRIRVEPDGRTVVQPRLGGLLLARRTPSGLRPEPTGASRPQPLAGFITQVRQLIQTCSKEVRRCRPR